MKRSAVSQRAAGVGRAVEVAVSVKNQVEGNIVQGVSRALFEEVTFDGNGVTSLDWKSYPILKFPDVPDLDIILVNRQDIAPLGAGELATVPIPAAIANAIFDATAIRMREVPFTPKRVLAGLEALQRSGRAA